MTKKRKPFIKFLNHGCYHGATMFCFGYNHSEIINNLEAMSEFEDDWISPIRDDEKEIDDNSLNAMCLKRTIEDTENGEVKHFHYIIIKKFDFSPANYITLAHEIVHLCQFYLPDFLDRDREVEAEAYFHSHMMRQCLDLLKQ